MLDDELRDAELAQCERVGAQHRLVEAVWPMLQRDHIVEFAAVAHACLDGEAHAGQHAAQGEHEFAGELRGEHGLLQQLVLGKVVRHAAVAADCEAPKSDGVRDLRDAPRWTRGHGEQRATGALRCGERASCTLRDGAVAAQQSAVEVERDQPETRPSRGLAKSTVLKAVRLAQHAGA